MAPKRRNKRKSAWSQRFSKLKQWLTVHQGEYPRQTAEDAKAKRLARWVNNLRTKYSKGKLLDAHTNQLQSLPGWRWSKRTAWVDMHAELVKWFDAGNDPRAAGSRVQDSFPSRGTVLGKWVHNQRYAYRHGQLAQPRVHALEALPAWTWKPAAPEAATPQQLAQRRQYKSWPRGSLAAASASVAPMDLD